MSNIYVASKVHNNWVFMLMLLLLHKAHAAIASLSHYCIICVVHKSLLNQIYTLNPQEQESVRTQECVPTSVSTPVGTTSVSATLATSWVMTDTTALVSKDSGFHALGILVILSAILHLRKGLRVPCLRETRTAILHLRVKYDHDDC